MTDNHLIKRVDPVNIVNETRYPIADTKSNRLATIVHRCQDQLREEGLVCLPDFLNDVSLKAIMNEAQLLRGAAHHTAGFETPYDPKPELKFPAGHPRRQPVEFSYRVIASDQVMDESILWSLYRWHEFQIFLARILELDCIYPYADPLGSINLVFMEQGDSLGWHYDHHDFVVSLLVQTSTSGGHFEVMPNARSEVGENYWGVSQVLNNGDLGCKQPSFSANSLMIFKGRNSLHRVTTVEGPRPRIIVLLCFDQKAGVVSSESSRLSRYGRKE